MTPTITAEANEGSIDDNIKTQIRIDLNAALANHEPLSPKEEESKA